MRRGVPANMQMTFERLLWHPPNALPAALCGCACRVIDGYAGYNRLLKRVDDRVALAYCWAHARRKLHEVAQSGTAPIAEDGLQQIAALYRIEKDIRGTTGSKARPVRGVCVNFVPWHLSLRHGKAFFEHDGELAFNAVPFTHRSLPLDGSSIERQVDQLCCRLIAREVASGSHRAPDF